MAWHLPNGISVLLELLDGNGRPDFSDARSVHVFFVIAEQENEAAESQKVDLTRPGAALAPNPLTHGRPYISTTGQAAKASASWTIRRASATTRPPKQAPRRQAPRHLRLANNRRVPFVFHWHHLFI